jgi:hypothetical protein
MSGIIPIVIFLTNINSRMKVVKMKILRSLNYWKLCTFWNATFLRTTSTVLDVKVRMLTFTTMETKLTISKTLSQEPMLATPLGMGLLI